VLTSSECVKESHPLSATKIAPLICHISEMVQDRR